MNIIEGYMPFKNHHTYYRIVGNPNNHKTPLILLHGGPGSSHNYFELLDDLAKMDDRTIIMYDQFGCGKSEVFDEEHLFNKDTWIEELEALRNHLNLDKVHLLGQSWGGMMEIIYLIDHKPKGIKSITLSSTLASASLYASEQHRMIKQLPLAYQEAIFEAERTNDFTSKQCQEAISYYMERHCCDAITDQSPECLKRKKTCGSQSYITAWGPNEFTPSGNLKDYEYTDKLHLINTPTLIISGTDDLSTPLVSKSLYDNIPNATWHLLPNARHMCFVDQNKQYKEILTDFLNKHD